MKLLKAVSKKIGRLKQNIIHSEYGMFARAKMYLPFSATITR